MNVEELVIRSRDGDVAAFEQLVRRYQGMAFGYSRALCGDPHLAEDSTQQAFLVAFLNLANLRDPARFGGWLRGIVRFETLRLLRPSRPSPGSAAQLDAAVDPTPGPAEQAEERESLERVESAFAALPDRERTVATLYYLHDQSQRDVARFLNLTVSTVNNRLRSARTRLRNGGIFAMTQATRHQTPEFSNRVGTVLNANGPMLDARFEQGQRPSLSSTVALESDESSPLSTAFVAQYVEDDVVRLIVPDNLDGAKAIRANSMDSDQGQPVGTSLDHSTIRAILSAHRRTGGGARIVETGIKAIDAFAPIVEGGSVALVGDMNIGKVVVLEELVQRIAASSTGISVFVFLQVPDEVGSLHPMAQEHSGTINATFLPVGDASADALADMLEAIDSVIVMSRELGEKQLYPAIDASTSWSNALPAGDRAVIEPARRTLRDPARAETVANYVTQPFFVAEPFTKRPGVVVPRASTMSDLGRIVAGDQSLDETDLYMIGALPSAS